MTVNKFFSEFSIKLSQRVFTMLLVVIQSCGIAFFEKKGTVLLFVVIFLSWKGFKYLTLKHASLIVLIFLFLILNKFLNPAFEFSNLLYQCGLVFEAYIFLLSYQKRGVDKLVDDFYNALNIIFVHSIIGYLLYMVIPFAFIEIHWGYPYKTLLYFFYVTGNYEGLARNTGLLWEPGLLQLMLNILLFYSIKRQRSNWFLIILTISIISTFSTSGYFCLAINYIYYILSNFKKRRKFVLILLSCTLLSSSLLFFIWANIADKLGGENLSGLARYRDLYIGFELIKERPWMGHGLFDVSYLYAKSYVSRIEVQLFGAKTLDIIGSISGGYVNGILDIFAWFGIPAALLIFYQFYKSKFVGNIGYERVLFFIIMCFTFFAEPITYTSFFLIFPLSAFIFKNELESDSSLTMLSNE